VTQFKNVKLGDIADILNGLPDAKQLELAENAGATTYSFIQPNHLGIFNDIQDALEIKRQTPVDDSYLIRRNDILLKRLNPDMATLINEDVSNTTFSSNLFVIRVINDYYPAYIACMLENQGISWLNSNIVGSLAAIKSISIKALAELKVPAIEQEKQKAIGQLWLLHKKRKKLLNDFITEDRMLMSALTRSVATSAEEEE
jgi:restriction endonuclease S subunit